MTSDLARRCKDIVVELGLGSEDMVTKIVPLRGGVASDIARVELGPQHLCAKFALPKLKVAEDWRAPVHRNRAEFAWLEVASNIAPESAIHLYGRSEHAHGFVMEYVEGPSVYLWKTALLEGRSVGDEAPHVGDVIGRIHAASAAPTFDRSEFDNRDDFEAIRLEPYLIFTAHRCHAVEAELRQLADELYRSDQVLVHGDVSPKNILFRNGRPILLDAECATMGDASFDPAFCLNHLILKAIHLPASRSSLLANAEAFWQAYRAHIDWEPEQAVERRVCKLLPALMLARTDGKSPVEYLGEQAKANVRTLAVPMIQSPRKNLQDLIGQIADQVKRLNA